MLKFDERGLIPAICQDHLTGQVRMMAYMNQQALERTLESGKATFFSRSRGALWTKGETSGNVLEVVSVMADCDADTLLLSVRPLGPSCHTGRPACFFRRVSAAGELADQPTEAAPFLMELGAVLEARKASSEEKSYTKALLSAGPEKIGAKLREEAGELADAIKSESDERVLSEAGDVLYHTMVALTQRGLTLRQVIEVLAKRTHQSGHAEKASRA
ncbi:MAG: bifunctional phosphoribosyl-AMP cyclohydrolase/phosphoribosyl-ATP diphosphatase HisIE [Myxococcales bacterium]|nr:MAG: bifunctional phosphoribosyl-AMP cyclohydrolase/phosphoribosyl-ATP diphosphatase HisIE [Myxococcales bacterium]